MASAEGAKLRVSPPMEPNVSGDGRTESRKRKRKENWRLVILSQPRSPRGKYEKPEETFNSGVDPEALTVEPSERNDHLSRPPLRILVGNKRQFSTLPTTYPDYSERMDKKIEHTWSSIYNYYRKAKLDLARKSSKTSKSSKRCRKRKGKSSKSSAKEKPGKDKKEKGGKGKKGKGKEKETAKSETKSTSSEKSEEEIEKERAQWVNLRSAPKALHRPEPINRGPIADLDEIKPRMGELSAPKSVTLKFSEQPIVDLYKIKEAALTYEPTERVLELAKPPEFRSIKEEPIIPGAVKPTALQYVASPRITELSAPRQTQNARDADLKEDPFVISPNALKYVATARIVELARPTTRK